MGKDNLGLKVPQEEIESLARLLLPKIQQVFESEDGQNEFAQWKRMQVENDAKKLKG